MPVLKVLAACEYSGVVRDAFKKLGHDAWSCDFLDTEIPGQHYQGDIKDIYGRDWDIVICFPPCTYIASSGIHWNARRPGRAAQTEEAIEFVKYLLSSKTKYVALENPIGVLSTRVRKPDQIIQPWQFGHPESKATCLWLKNLPPLKPTNILEKPLSGRWSNQTPSGQNKLAPGKDRWKDRSRTYQGIGNAMAFQWSEYILKNDHNGD